MTFFKQIAVMLSIFLLVILTTVLVLNFVSANQSVQDRLYEDAKNTATSLSLSLGSAKGDLPMMSTMINANFDSGNYIFISLVDVENKILYERKSDTNQTSSVPQWFKDIITIEAPVASANVSADWKQVGILNVQSDASYAYAQLYNISINLLISFGVLMALGLILLNTLLAAALKPLKQVQLQAEAVTRNEFIIQEDIPKTKEFKNVVLGMNKTIAKVKAMFEKGNAELKHQKELEYIDPETKLKNRKYLIDKLPEYLKVDATSEGGIYMMMSLSGVIEANEAIGHQRVDNLFIEIANIFKVYASNCKESIISRMNGTEFSILLPDCKEHDALELAYGICDSADKAIENSGLNTDVTFMSIGLYEYIHTQNIGQLLSLCDNALTQAKFNNSHIHLDKAENETEVMSKDAWRKIINQTLDANGFCFTLWTVVDAKTTKIHHNIISITMQTMDGTIYSYGQFMTSAHQVGLSSKIYQNVINMIFMFPDMRLEGKTCSLRLSYEYLKETDTYADLLALFKSHALKLPFKLVIEMPDKFAHQNPKQVKLYKKLFETYNVEMGIFEFIGENVDYEYLKDIRPIYIKAEAEYFINQSDQAISSLRLITDTLGASLVATSVMDMVVLNKLKEKDIYVVQGRVTELLKISSEQL
jgi:diguanylate cyclase (GGDEF)-like protein